MNPKQQFGDRKAQLHLIPTIAMELVAKVHKTGHDRYGPWNWRKDHVNATVYVSAIMRHLNAWRDGEDNDPDSGVSHLAHIGANVNILMDAIHTGSMIDDRVKLPVRDADGYMILDPDEPIVEGDEIRAEDGLWFMSETSIGSTPWRIGREVRRPIKRGDG